MQLRAAFIVTVAILVPVATACNDDGRTLRPAKPDQVGSVSTLAPVTEPSLDAVPIIDAGSEPGLGQVDSTIPIVTATTVATTLEVTSSAFDANGAFLVDNTCQGTNVSPALDWTAAPEGTIEIAITMVDLDKPDFVHWAIAGIDPLSTALGQGVVPEFAMQGINGSGQPGYTGPCPPNGETHTYQITVHYLEQQTELGDGAPGADLIASIEGSTFASASTTGTYSQG